MIKAITAEQFIAQSKSPETVKATPESAAELMLLPETPEVLAKLRERRAGKTMAEHAHDLGLFGAVPTMMALEEYVAKLEMANKPAPPVNKNMARTMNEARALSRGDWDKK